VPDWAEFLLFVVAWAPILVGLHELGHAAAALILTDGDVSIGLNRLGMDGGWASYEPDRLRRPRDEAWILAAGPAASLAVAVALWLIWSGGEESSLVSLTGVGAITATFLFATSALPLRYGRGFGDGGESDGRGVWRILTGGPPRIDVELREPFEHTVSGTRPVFVVVLGLIVVLTLLVDPLLAVELVALFVVAIIWARVL
jgi:hypothetical protein